MRALPDLNNDFLISPLEFEDGIYRNVFAAKNNKTVAETLEHRRYVGLKNEFITAHPDLLDLPLGEALFKLKNAEKVIYTRFLNKYGDSSYSIFRLANKSHWLLKGIYAYFHGDKLVYIGRCKDSIRKRIDQGYGKIHPKNCYLDGQATNCHLNSLVTIARPDVSLRVHPMVDPVEIEDTERDLIRTHNPDWNIQRV
ncbi:MAG: hypothetical protein ACJAR0_003685 [Candidatus Azotimanducaceae bacterium]|jgi:hypothetical protein